MLLAKQMLLETEERPCVYDPLVKERKIVARLTHQAQYDLMIRCGFRRSYDYVYRPIYENSDYCYSLRVQTRRFQHSKSFRRIMNINSDLKSATRIIDGSQTLSDEDYALFIKYQTAQHGESAMATMPPDDYRAMMLESPIHSEIVDFFYDRAPTEGGVLPKKTRIASCLMDCVEDSLSAVYSYYDPDFPKRSLGSYIILWMIEECQKRNCSYLYLGYEIPSCPKMRYKVRFGPVQRLIKGKWQ